MTDLAAIGWDPAWAEAFAAVASDEDRPGRVVRQDRGAVAALTEAGEVVATETSRRKRRDLDTPATGDWIAIGGPDDDPIVTNALPRRTALVRRAAGDAPTGQVVAANADLVAVVIGLDQDWSPRRLERSLVVAWDSGATPLVVLNKADAAADPVDEIEHEARSRAPGVDVVITSATSGDGVAEIERRIDRWRTIVFLGPSGVGKSTITNRLAGSAVMGTGDVRVSDAKGRHTTTTRELFALPAGGAVIDTPGIRAIGPWSGEPGLRFAFPDVVTAADSCRFRDCAHGREPGCAVHDEIAAGTISGDRLESYRSLVDEIAALDTARNRS